MKLTKKQLKDLIREELNELDVIGARSAREKAEQSLAQTELSGAEKSTRMKEIVAAMAKLNPLSDEWQALRQELNTL